MNRSIRNRFLAAGAIAAALGATAALAQSPSATPAAPGAEPRAASPGSAATPMYRGMGRGEMHHGRMHGGGSGARHEKAGMPRMDADGDGKLTRAEFEAAQKARNERATQAFEAADTDRDGVLSAEERRAWHDAMRAQAGRRDGARPRSGPGAPQPTTPPIPGA